MDINKYRYQLNESVNVLTEEQKENLWEELGLNKEKYLNELLKKGLLRDPIAIEWRYGQALYRTFRLKLVGEIIEVDKEY